MNTPLIMTKNVYDQPKHDSKAETERELASKNTERMVDALIGASLNEPDRKWVEGRLLAHASHEDPWVRRAVITATGHLARVHKAVDPKLVAAVKAMSKDRELAGTVSDALDDIKRFAGVA